MILRHSKNPLPRNFSAHPHSKGVVAEFDIKTGKTKTLRAKVLVFKTPAALNAFWKNVVGSDLGKGCLGAVNALAHEVHDFTGKNEQRYIRVDPTYYCLIGLVVGYLSHEIVAHEATHAGFACAKRSKRDFWCSYNELDEEKVCYPTGKISSAILQALNDKGLM